MAALQTLVFKNELVVVNAFVVFGIPGRSGSELDMGAVRVWGLEVSNAH